ncbi:MAG: ROK family protein [Pseudomonadota bacterium]
MAEWIAPEPPGQDGKAFLSMCLDQATRLLTEANLPMERFFGVGLAISAEIDREAGVITEAPTFGWSDPINLREMVADRLHVPLVIETPSIAMTQAEAEFGKTQGIRNIVTLHCSLGFGMGVRRVGETGSSVDFGRVLTRAKSGTPNPRLLDELCGGVSVLNELEGIDRIARLPDSARSTLLSSAVERAKTENDVAEILRDRGRLTAQYFGLLLDMLTPDLLMLAGPLAQVPDFVEGFKEEFDIVTASTPDVLITDMTPTGASRWLSLRANIIYGDIDFAALKERLVA